MSMRALLLTWVLVPIISYGQAQPLFIKSNPIWKHFDYSSGRSPFPFGLPPKIVDANIDRIVVAMNDQEFLKRTLEDRSIESIARAIRQKVASVTQTNEGTVISQLSQDWFLAEGVCQFVRATCVYDHSNHEQDQPTSVQIAHARFDYIYKQDHPSAVCWGIAVSVRDVARATGLKADFVNGIARGLGKVAPKQSDRNHGIVVFTFSGGLEVPADVSSYICDFQNNRKASPKTEANSWMVLPRRPEAWEIFLATFSADIGEEVEIYGDKQNKHKLLTMSYVDWAKVDTGYLKSLQDWLASQEK